MGEQFLTRRVVAAAAILLLAVNVALLLAIARTHPALWSEGQLPGLDFAAFWSASWITLNGELENAYVRELLAAVQIKATGGSPAFAPWLYPPTYILMVLPLATSLLRGSFRGPATWILERMDVRRHFEASFLTGALDTAKFKEITWRKNSAHQDAHKELLLMKD